MAPRPTRPRDAGLPQPQNATYQAGDRVKSQTKFAEYYAGYGWFGPLMQMEPGHGYQIKKQTGSEATYVMAEN